MRLNAANAKVVVRQGLMRAGARTTPAHLAILRSALSYLEIGRWLRTSPDLSAPVSVPDEFALFDMAIARVTGSRPLYLEFGVYAGRSMRYWSEHLHQPQARFVGFDSFEGLPEDWRPTTAKGTFATGQPPKIDDPRVSFEVGWFDDTLPSFEVPDHDQLIVNIDSDLYSSAKTVLTWAEPLLVPGTLVYFDEFPDRDHELRAFNELVDRTGLRLRPLGIAHGGIQWLFEVAG